MAYGDPYEPYDPDEAWDMPPYIQPGTEGWEGLQGMLGQYEGLDYRDFPAPDPFLGMVAQNIPLPQIIQYIRNQIGGANVGGRVEKYRELGLGQVNRAMTGAFNRLRGQSAATGGRGSSYAARARAEGTAVLGQARGAVETGAMQYEDTLRQAGFGRGMTVLNALESARRGDVSEQERYRNQFMQMLALEQGGLGAQTDIYGTMAGMEMSEAQMQMAFNWMKQNVLHGGPDAPGWEEYLGQFVPQLPWEDIGD